MSATQLPDLLQAAIATPAVFSRLRYRSNQDLQDARKRVVRLRNRVMHPVSPLIENDEAIEELMDTLRILEGLQEAIQAGSLGPRGPVLKSGVALRTRILDRAVDGLARIRELDDMLLRSIPTTPGVYLVLAPAGITPRFLGTSIAGRFKGKNPTVSRQQLQAKWIKNEQVIYVGRASRLSRRIRQFLRFGQGRPVAHWGGRFVWQLKNVFDFELGWYECSEPTAEEARLIGRSVVAHSKPPFGNVQRPRSDD